MIWALIITTLMLWVAQDIMDTSIAYMIHYHTDSAWKRFLEVTQYVTDKAFIISLIITIIMVLQSGGVIA